MDQEKGIETWTNLSSKDTGTTLNTPSLIALKLPPFLIIMAGWYVFTLLFFIILIFNFFKFFIDLLLLDLRGGDSIFKLFLGTKYLHIYSFVCGLFRYSHSSLLVCKRSPNFHAVLHWVLLYPIYLQYSAPQQ